MVRWRFLPGRRAGGGFVLLLAACGHSSADRSGGSGAGSATGGHGNVTAQSAGGNSEDGKAGHGGSANGASGGDLGTGGSAGHGAASESGGHGNTAGHAGHAATAGTSTGGSSGSGANGGDVNDNGGTPNGGNPNGGYGNGVNAFCTLGAYCAPEGATCQGTTCCALIYTCESGRWDNPVSSCPLGCPATLPNEGDACDNCNILCSFGECDTAGKNQTHSAGCTPDFTWHVNTYECDPQCCTQNEECQSGRCSQTRCVQALTPPAVAGGRACWDETDCQADQFCFGSKICACDQTCDFGSTQGYCLPVDAGCCTSDADCDATEECLLGICQTKPSPGACRVNADCPPGGDYCSGGTACLCGQDCTGSKLGVCMPE